MNSAELTKLCWDEQKKVPLPGIDDKLAQLKFYETDLENDEVKKAVKAMRRILDPYFKWFQSRQVVITYHGSLQYNDPRNLDETREIIAGSQWLREGVLCDLNKVIQNREERREKKN